MVQSYRMNPDVRRTVKKVHHLFRSREMTLSVAESCTGGLISHFLTSLQGSSEFFESGLVTYSEEAKKIILGVSFAFIKRYGLVSEEMAKRMADRTRFLLKTDYALSTTGILGPRVLEGKKRGLVYAAVSRKAGISVREMHLSSGRMTNKSKASTIALQFLIECVIHDEQQFT